jgi:hypothetical protein
METFEGNSVVGCLLSVRKYKGRERETKDKRKAGLNV